MSAVAEDDTATVSVTVMNCRAVDQGKLVAVCDAELVLDGVAVTLHGVGVEQLPGALRCRPPCWRDPGSGRWLPAVTLPPEIQDAVADATLREAAMVLGARASWERIALSPQPDRATPPRLAASTSGDGVARDGAHGRCHPVREDGRGGAPSYPRGDRAA
jgi:hypothetical protein